MPEIQVIGKQYGLAVVLRCLLASFTACVLAACGLAVGDAERLERASAAFEEGDYRAAIIDAKSLLQNDPSNVDARILLGKASLEVGDGNTAISELNRAVELGASETQLAVEIGRALLANAEFARVLETIDPADGASATDRSTLHRIRGSAYLGVSEPEGARDAFLAALDEDDANLEAMLGIVSSYLSEGNVEQATATLNEVISRNDSSAEAWLLSGQLSLQVGNHDAARTSFLKAEDLAVSKDDEDLLQKSLLGLAEVYLQSGDLETAKTVLQRLQAMGADNPYTQFIDGRIAYLESRYEDAISALQSVQSAAPAATQVQILLGASHLNAGNLRQAEMQLSSAIAADPSNIDARRLLAETRVKQGNADDAVQLLTPLLESGNSDPDMLALAARVSVSAGDSGQAIEFLERRATQQEGNVSAAQDLAIAYLAAGRLDDARAVISGMRIEDDDDAKRQGFSRVLLFVAEDNLQAAIDESRRLQNQFDDDARLALVAGSLLQQSGDVEAARAAFASVTEIEPSNPVGLVRLARLEIAEGEVLKAEEAYLDALELVPDSARVMTELAQLSLRQNDADGAREWLARASQADPGLVAPRLIGARLALLSGEYAPAIESATAVLAIDETNAEASSIAGKALEGSGRVAEALERYRDAVAVDGQNLDYRTDLVRALVRTGQYDEAEVLAQEALEIDSSHTASAAALVTALQQQGDSESALKVARSFASANPDDGMAQGLLAEIHLSRDEIDESLDAYDRALALSNTAEIVIGASRARSRAGKADALTPMVEYLEGNPEDMSVRMALAGAYLEGDDHADAIRQYERLLEREPQNPVVLNNLAWSYFQDSDPRARDTARRAYDLLPDNSSVADTYAWILIQTGEPEAGVEILRRMVDEGRATAEHRYHLAEGLAATGAGEGARVQLESILASDEQFASRRAAMALLESL